MGTVYVIVVAIIAAALAFNLMSDKVPAPPGEAPADIIGSPSDFD